MIRIVTDGACRQGEGRGGAFVPYGTGGWAAIIDRGDGAVPAIHHGSEVDTNNGVMELTAAIEGLRQVPGHGRVCLFTDYDEVGYVYWMWSRGELPDEEFLRRKGRDLWIELADELARVRPSVQVVGKRSPMAHRDMIRLAHHAAREAMHGTDPAASGKFRQLSSFR